MSFSNVNKSSAPTFQNTNKASTTFAFFLKHGKEPLMSELDSFTFESVIFPDGTKIKDVTFATLTDLVWANLPKS